MLRVTDLMVPHFMFGPSQHLAMTTSMRIFLMRTNPMLLPGLLHHGFPPTANKSHALPQTRKSMAGWDIFNMMTGGSGLEAFGMWLETA